jgi:hypothetical protein
LPRETTWAIEIFGVFGGTHHHPGKTSLYQISMNQLEHIPQMINSFPIDLWFLYEFSKNWSLGSFWESAGGSARNQSSKRSRLYPERGRHCISKMVI